MKWWIFIKERFEPASHFTMIIVFLLVHVLIAKSILRIEINNFSVFLLFIGTSAFYFKLRLYDEVKDFELDQVINPTRPLPRGLLNHRDMYLGMVICILLEASIFATQGQDSFKSIVITILYSLIMYKEFFIKEKIRPHLTTYAILHTIVTSFLSIAIFSFLSKESFIRLIVTKECLYFALANWLLFNIFEFGRKTFAISEERQNVDTYSSLFGKTGAVILVISQALMAHLLVINILPSESKILYWTHSLLFFLLLSTSFCYIKTNQIKAAKNYRLMSSAYIIIFYLTLAVALWY